jgi:hypothetical protein
LTNSSDWFFCKAHLLWLVVSEQEVL